MLIDGNSLGYTQHHTGPARILDNGLHTQAIEGFARSITFKLKELAPTMPVVLWDGHAAWRYALYPPYKSGRERTAKQLADRAAYKAQVPYLQRLLKALGIAQVKDPGAEADDLAYQLTLHLLRHGHRVHLMSSDTDWWQGIAEGVSCQGCRKDSQRIDHANFAETTGYPSPRAFIEGKALISDTADDIEGIPGIGAKTAKRLLKRYGSQEGFYHAVATNTADLTPKPLLELASAAGRERWDRNLRLMDLSRAPLIRGSDLQQVITPANPERVTQLAEALQLGTVRRYAREWLTRLKTTQENQPVLHELLANL